MAEPLKMTPMLASLPVTDLHHVIEWINKERRFQEVTEYERKRRSKYMQNYNSSKYEWRTTKR